MMIISREGVARQHEKMEEAILARAVCNYGEPVLIQQHIEQLFKKFPIGLRLEFARHPDHNGGYAGNLLAVVGNILVPYDGSEYGIPIAIRLLPDYPRRAPICLVVPTADMFINESENVAKDGQVFMKQLGSGWLPGTSNLVLVVEAMVAIFAANTPLWSRAGAAGGGEVADHEPHAVDEPSSTTTVLPDDIEMLSTAIYRQHLQPPGYYETEAAEWSSPPAAAGRTSRAHGGAGVVKRSRASLLSKIEGFSAFSNKLSRPSPVQKLKKSVVRQEQGDDNYQNLPPGYTSNAPGTPTQGRKVDYAETQKKLATYSARREVAKELEQLEGEIVYASEEHGYLTELEEEVKQALNLIKQDKDDQKRILAKLEEKKRKLEAKLKALNEEANVH